MQFHSQDPTTPAPSAVMLRPLFESNSKQSENSAKVETLGSFLASCTNDQWLLYISGGLHLQDNRRADLCKFFYYCVFVGFAIEVMWCDIYMYVTNPCPN